MELNLKSRTTLNDETTMPWLGLGVYQSPPGDTTYKAVRAALETGYRHIDTARVYGNESDVGKAVKDSGVPRADVFITTKVWNSDQGYDSTIKACKQSLSLLGTNYLDLFLIHFPVTDKRKDTWKALHQLQKDGLCRSIGVSNYTVRHLKELMEYSPVVPAVNQVEFHPFLFQKELLHFCREHTIQLEAYSPLAQATRMDHPELVKIASHYKKTPAQILIRWCLEHEIVAIPKSVKAARIGENAKVFDFKLSPADLEEMNGWDENLRTCWDPSDVP